MSAKPKARRVAAAKLRQPFTTPLVHPDDQFIEIRHLCIPLDAASVEALREKMAVALESCDGWMALDGADAVLSTLGIKRRKSK
jgi:hypothetical protein